MSEELEETKPTMTFDLCTGYQKSSCCSAWISEENQHRCHKCREIAQNECVECPYDKCPKRKEIK